MAGSAAWPTPWTPRATTTTSSTSTPSSRSRCARAATCRWCSTIPRSSCARALPTRPAPLKLLASRGQRRQRGAGIHVRRVAQRAAGRATRARRLGAVPHARRLRPGALRARAGRGADRGRFPDQDLLRRLPQQRLRHPCLSGRRPRPAVDLHLRPHRRLHEGRGAARPRRRRRADGVQRIRPARPGEHQPGHRSRHRRPRLRHRRSR